MKNSNNFLVKPLQIRTSWLISIIVVSLISSAQTYTINVDSGIENECFHERVPVGTKLGFSYEVIEGGFYDIDVDIRDPNNVILYQEDRSSSGKLTIEANIDGPYKFCFSNVKSSYTPKTIIFDIDKANAPDATKSDGTKEDDEITKVVNMAENLMLAAISSRHDVRYLLARDRVHRKVNDQTNSRIVWWSGIEFILLLLVSLGQVWYLRRFFEVRRKA